MIAYVDSVADKVTVADSELPIFEAGLGESQQFHLGGYVVRFVDFDGRGHYIAKVTGENAVLTRELANSVLLMLTAFGRV